MIKIIRFALILLAAFALPAAAQSIPSAADLPTGHRPQSWHVWNASAMGYNQIVFGDQIKVYRKMPWGEGKTLLTSDSHWRFGANTILSPAYCRPALMIGVSPLLIMDLDVHYGPGINVLDYTYKSYRDPYNPWKLGTPDRYGGLFHQVEANMALKAAAWRFAALNLTDLMWFKSKDYFFNWDTAAIVKDGWALRNKSFLLFETWENWRIFANYEQLNYFESGYSTELISTGLVVTRPSFHNLTVIAQAGYHLRNPKFTGMKSWIAAIMEWDFPDRK